MTEQSPEFSFSVDVLNIQLHKEKLHWREIQKLDDDLYTLGTEKIQ